MSDTIWQFSLGGANDWQIVAMPEGARVLSARVQHGGIYMWALVDPDAPKINHTVRIVGTGHLADGLEDWEFVDTVEMLGGELIFHVFILPPTTD